MGRRNGRRLAALGGTLSCVLAGTGAWAQSAPVVVDDLYSANINNSLTIPAASGLLANDTGFDVASHRLETVDRRTQYGGALSVAADGSFSYAPPPGFKGTDSFQYVVRNRFGATTGLAQIAVGGQRVWYVNSAAPTGGKGTRAEPFNNFVSLNGTSGTGDIDGTGDTIFVFAGNYNGVAFDLEPGQLLLGERAGLDLPGTAFDIPPGGTPVLFNTGTAPTIELFGAGGQVRGFQVNGVSNRIIATGLGGASDFVLRDLDIPVTATTQMALDLLNPSGSSRIENVAISGPGPAISVGSNAGTLDFVRTTVDVSGGTRPLFINFNSGIVRFDATSLIKAGGTRGFLLQNSVATSQIILPRLELSGGLNSDPLVWIQNNNAPASSVELSGGVLLSNAAQGASLRAASGKLRIGGSDSSLSTVQAEALDLDSIELLGDVTLASISSTNSPRTGVRLINVTGTARIAVGALTINQPAAQAVLMDTVPGLHLDVGLLNSTGGTTGISINGGRVTVADAASSLTTTAGVAVSCFNAQANLSFATLNGAGGTNAVLLDHCPGTLTAAGGTLTSIPAGGQAVVRLLASDMAFNYGGTLDKSSTGLLASIQELPGTGSVRFTGTATALPGSQGVFLRDNVGPVRFSTLNLGTSSQRFTSAAITLISNTGLVDLGDVGIYASGVDALAVQTTATNSGLIRSGAASQLDVTGAAAALRILPSGSTPAQPLDLQFASLSAPDAGDYGVVISRGSGSLNVTGRSTFGAKTTAGIQLDGALSATFTEVDIAGAFDGVKLSNHTGGFRILGDGDPLNTHTNGAGGSFSNIVDNAFDIQDSRTILVADLEVDRTGASAIRIRRSQDLEFANVDLRDVGNAPFEHVYDLAEGITSGVGASGYLRIHDSELRRFTHHGVFLRNYADTLALTIRDNVIADNLGDAACGPGNCGGHGIWISTTGTAQIIGLIRNNQLEDLDNWGILADLGGGVSPRLDLTIEQNTIVGHAYGGPSSIDNGLGGVSLVQQAGTGSTRAVISNNTVRNMTGVAGGAAGVIDVFQNGSNASVDVSVTGNRVEQAYHGPAYRVRNNNASGSAAAVRVRMDNNIGPAADLAEQALRFDTGFNSGGGDNQLLLRNNQFTAVPATTTIDTVLVEARGSNTSCVDITGNTAPAPSTPGFYPLRYSHQVSTGAARLQGMTGNTAGQAITYLNANNTLAAPGAQVVANNIQSATCIAPTPPATVP